MRQEQNLNQLNALGMVNWSRYLESLCNAYAQWWQVYTITDVVGRQRVESEPLLLDFMVQMVPDREERGKEEKIERLGVLEGLRKYSSDHVFLVGRPGSGKSTALARLVLEEAQRSREAREASETSERTPLNPPLPSYALLTSFVTILKALFHKAFKKHNFHQT